jgi:hypothetical protein
MGEQQTNLVNFNEKQQVDGGATRRIKVFDLETESLVYDTHFDPELDRMVKKSPADVPKKP